MIFKFFNPIFYRIFPPFPISCAKIMLSRSRSLFERVKIRNLEFRAGSGAAAARKKNQSQEEYNSCFGFVVPCVIQATKLILKRDFMIEDFEYFRRIGGHKSCNYATINQINRRKFSQNLPKLPKSRNSPISENLLILAELVVDVGSDN